MKAIGWIITAVSTLVFGCIGFSVALELDGRVVGAGLMGWWTPRGAPETSGRLQVAKIVPSGIYAVDIYVIDDSSALYARLTKTDAWQEASSIPQGSGASACLERELAMIERQISNLPRPIMSCAGLWWSVDGFRHETYVVVGNDNHIWEWEFNQSVWAWILTLACGTIFGAVAGWRVAVFAMSWLMPMSRTSKLSDTGRHGRG